MRVLITGGNGQVGTALRDRFGGLGHIVIAPGRADLDLGHPATLGHIVADTRPDLVVNAAAYTAVDRAEDDAAAAFAVNADGAAALAATAAACGAPFVHFSTDYVFDGRKGAPYDEDDVPRPNGVYGASKLAGERGILAAHPRAIILRTAWVCSPTGHNFLKTMLRLGAERDSLDVVDDQRGAPTFAADLAAAVAAMAPRLIAAPAGDPAFGIFHLTGAPHTTWHGFASAIFAGAATRGLAVPHLRAIATSDYPTRAARPADSRLDCSRIASIHGIAAADWRAALEQCLDALLATKGDLR